MPLRPIRIADGRSNAAELRAGFVQIREEFAIPGRHSQAAVAEAERVEGVLRSSAVDATHLDLVTIDPPGSRDLDQALYIERRGDGYRVHYAIADTTAFVAPGGALDADAWARGLTYYSPDARALLYPPLISEGAASLLAGEVRPSLLWTLDLDSAGELVGSGLVRAQVESRAQLTYAEVQRELDLGEADSSLALLREVGELRAQLERDRGGVHLPLPEQLIVPDPEDGWRPTYRAPLPVEDHNAQISLLTGIAAARMMVEARVGLLRVVGGADENALSRLRRAAAALEAPWPADLTYSDWIRTLEPAEPAHAPLLHEATGVIRGATYVAFDGEVPDDHLHAALATEYAHVTAPLRRLADRFTLDACAAISAGDDVPDVVKSALPRLPEVMRAAERRANALERAVVDLVESVFLAGQVGRRFRAVVVDSDRVQLCDGLAVRAAVEGADLPLGEVIEVELIEADPAKRSVRFRAA